MLSYAKLARSPSLFRTFTGLEVSEFDSLYKKVESECERVRGEEALKVGQEKEVGEGGRHFKLDSVTGSSCSSSIIDCTSRSP